MLFNEKPESFNPKFEVVGCFVLCGGEIILLHRQDCKPQGNTWGIPSGKINPCESAEAAVLREVEEETGLALDKEKIKFFKTVFARYSDYDFIYHIFSTQLDDKFKVKINQEEHKDARWTLLSEARALPLIENLDGCIEMFSIQ